MQQVREKTHEKWRNREKEKRVQQRIFLEIYEDFNLLSSQEYRSILNQGQGESNTLKEHAIIFLYSYFL